MEKEMTQHLSIDQMKDAMRAPHLLEEARARAAREGLSIRFDEGFAETLPYP
jgi:hypothetical protein